jgi:serine protease Do
MQINKLYILLLVSFTLCACAHKSGHGNVRTSTHYNTSSEMSTDNKTVQIPNNVVEESPRTGDKMEGPEIFRKCSNAVFMVFTSDGENTYQGSGFFINNHGLAVSNYHVFENTGIGAEQIKLEGSDNVYKVEEVLQKNKTNDFIIFRVNCDKTSYIPISFRKPEVGDKVFAIGSPHGLENTFSSGDVSQWRDENLMQISALIDHGSSGGALINEYGEVIGITSGTFYDGSQANLNYAWSINVIKPYVNLK